MKNFYPKYSLVPSIESYARKYKNKEIIKKLGEIEREKIRTLWYEVLERYPSKDLEILKDSYLTLQNEYDENEKFLYILLKTYLSCVEDYKERTRKESLRAVIILWRNTEKINLNDEEADRLSLRIKEYMVGK